MSIKVPSYQGRHLYLYQFAQICNSHDPDLLYNFISRLAGRWRYFSIFSGIVKILICRQNGVRGKFLFREFTILKMGSQAKTVTKNLSNKISINISNSG